MTAVSDLRAAREFWERRPAFKVEEGEYRRLLGYPRHHPPAGRALELMDRARRWYEENGRPWIYRRETEVDWTSGSPALGGVEFASKGLVGLWRSEEVKRAVLFAASAGSSAEVEAARLWTEEKPDEYYFLQVFAAAVVEALVSGLNGRICETAAAQGLAALPHFSPGYDGWDVAEQPELFRLIDSGRREDWPEPLAVLPSGMIRPTKSLLGVIGLAPMRPGAKAVEMRTPCEGCSFSPCRFRRSPYRHGGSGGLAASGDGEKRQGRPFHEGAAYTVNPKTLEKWAKERLRLRAIAGGALEATFRFDGKTCSNLGRPFVVEYRAILSGREDGHVIRASECRPAAGDEGHREMCAYLKDAPALIRAMAEEKPLIGRPLREVLEWNRLAAPSGCHCTAETRAHKWGLFLEVLHFALSSDSP